MNRLVLIGNGYDLAAGLKTSYEDFLVDYFKSAFLSVKKGKKEYEDAQIFVKNCNPYEFDSEFDKRMSSISSIAGLLSNKIAVFDNPKSQHFVSAQTKFEVTVKSGFLIELLRKTNKVDNWRDIEGFYFKKLQEYYKRIEEIPLLDNLFRNEETYNRYLDTIVDLNENFDQFKNQFAAYIGKISISLTGQNSVEPLTSFRKIIDPISSDNFSRFFDKSKTKDEVENIFVANFNYTPTFNNEFLKENYNEDNIVVHNIHGYYEKPEEIIFGYGDVSHPLYEKMESHGDDELLRFIKSFHYPQKKSYIDLMNFIESDQFEVQVIGHSLGLSDRVLLKSIFENENCKMIKLYHRGKKTDMSHKYMALSRHCSDKAAMRRKILEYDEKDVVNEKN